MAGSRAVSAWVWGIRGGVVCGAHTPLSFPTAPPLDSGRSTSKGCVWWMGGVRTPPPAMTTSFAVLRSPSAGHMIQCRCGNSLEAGKLCSQVVPPPPPPPPSYPINAWLALLSGSWVFTMVPPPQPGSTQRYITNGYRDLGRLV